ncbi:neuromedin-U receptor 2-like [Orbicella faveolata]|uniref:neuromedin-U receptor 2-like n=1 Tax=Orbicella faveolata TaxID=48498 RepID=UPI0009E28264|nr:neuromedin-U receptor 2-like [Orbicella faveolata]
MLNSAAAECISFTIEDRVSTKAIKATCYTVLMLLSLLGNAAVIAIVAKNRHMRTTTNYLIANMAVSDLLLSTFAVPREIGEIFIGFRGWLIDGLAGAVLCKVVYFFQDISTAVSIQSIVVITLDRYTGVVQPFREPIVTPKRRKFVIALIWLISMGLHGIYFYMARHQRVNGISICSFSFEPAFDNLQSLRINFIILSVFLIAIPLSVIAVLYSLILRDLKRKKPFWQKSSSLLVKNRRKEDTKIVRNVLAIIILFVFCILPIDIVGFLFFFVWYEEIPCGMDQLSFAAKFIFYSNASLNPYIYFLLNDRYRQGLRNIFNHGKAKECFPREEEISDIEMNAV